MKMVAWCMWSVVLVLGAGVGKCEEDAAAANRRLMILVPRKVGFKQFASAWCPSGGDNSTCTFSGFAVEVFETCIKRLSPKRPLLFDFLAVGDDVSHPSANAMIEALKNKGDPPAEIPDEEQPEIVDEAEVMEPEQILLHRFRHGSKKQARQYFLKFKDRGTHEAVWVDEDFFKDYPTLLASYKEAMQLGTGASP